MEAQAAAVAMAAGVKVPRVVSWALTMVLLNLLGAYLFFKPVEDTGLAQQVVVSMSATYAGAFECVRGWLQWARA